jgi:hypothetical protein
MLIVAARKHPNAVFVGQDKDPLCAKMTALNLCFFNVDGYAIYGDSLKLEYNRVWQTAQSALGGSVCELDQVDIEEFHVQIMEMFESEPEPDAHDNVSDAGDGARSSGGDLGEDDTDETGQESLFAFEAADL